MLKEIASGESLRSIQLIADHLEQPLANRLAHFQRAAVADDGGDMNEPVVLMTVGDTIVLAPLRADSQSTQRENVVTCGCGMQPVKQSVQVDPVFDVGGIFDYQVRHWGGGL